MNYWIALHFNLFCPCRRTASLCLSLSSPYSTDGDGDGDGVSICAAAIVALLLLLRCYWIDLNTDCIIVRVSVFQGTPLLPLILSSILYLFINYFVCWNYLWIIYCLFSNYYLRFDFGAEFEDQTMKYDN